jgi:hypothetical protein
MLLNSLETYRIIVLRLLYKVLYKLLAFYISFVVLFFLILKMKLYKLRFNNVSMNILIRILWKEKRLTEKWNMNFSIFTIHCNYVSNTKKTLHWCYLNMIEENMTINTLLTSVLYFNMQRLNTLERLNAVYQNK